MKVSLVGIVTEVYDGVGKKSGQPYRSVTVLEEDGSVALRGTAANLPVERLRRYQIDGVVETRVYQGSCSLSVKQVAIKAV